MDTIFNEFRNSMSRIKDNVMISFLAINFINLKTQKPFQNDIVFDVSFKENYISKESINSIPNDTVQEYGNSIRRHFLNDMVIVYERFASLINISHKNGNLRNESAIFDKKESYGYQDFIYKFCEIEEKDFLKNLVCLRNSIVHYNGKYNISNPVDYTFGDQIYQSFGSESQNISISFDNLFWIYEKIINTVVIINTKYMETKDYS